MADDLNDILGEGAAPQRTPRKPRAPKAESAARGGREPRANAERSRGQPRARVPFGRQRTQLDVDVQALRDSGQHVHWFNDFNGRLEEAEAAYYTYVTYAELGIRRSQEGHKSDDRVTKVVGTQENGEPIHAYLMKLDEEYYLQDQDVKVADDRKRVQDMKRASTDDTREDPGGFMQDRFQPISVNTSRARK